MIARIQVDDDAFIDARHIPVALIGLFEGWPTALVACAAPVAYRLWMGGPGMWPGVVGLVVVALLAGATHAWARRDAPVGPRHTFTLAVAVFVTVAATCVVTGAHARRLLERFWFDMLLSSVLGIGIIARIFGDVLEQARLDAERQRFRAVLDEATDAIRIVDADTGKILDCNRRDSEISGYAPDVIIGQDAHVFWPKEPAATDPRPLPGTRDGVVRAFGQPYRRRSGEIVAIDSARRVVKHGGRRYEIVIYREAAEREAREASERDAAELRAITLLAAAAAHEINNPLAIVMGSLDLLARHLGPGSPHMPLVDQGLVGVRRIRDIVLRMSHITRVETTPAQGHLPPILDIGKSTAVPEQEAS